MSKPAPHGHQKAGPVGGGSDSQADGSVAIQLSWAKLGRSEATRDQILGMNPGRFMEQGGATPELVMHGQSMVSPFDDPGSASSCRAW